jgi:proline iminopeptidase
MKIDTPSPYVKDRRSAPRYLCRVTASPPTTARARLAAWRRARPRTPPLERRTVRARGLDFAVWTSPAVEGAVPLLAINGGLIYGHDLLWPTFAPFAAERQVVLYDQRGRGDSASPPGARSARVEHDVFDVGALREALGIAHWDLAGHSWGGGLALLAAAADPAGTRRVVTFDAVGPTSGWLVGLHDRALAHLVSRGQTEEHAALAALDPRALHVEDPVRHAAYSRALYPAWFHDATAMLAPPPLALSASGAAVAAALRREGYDWRAPLATARARALLIHGAQDAVPFGEAHAHAALRGGTEVLVVPNAGHMPFFEQPALAFDAALSFLRG